MTELDEDGQFPKTLMMGQPGLILPKPLYRANAAEEIGEHLLWAAQEGGALAG